MSSWSLSSPKRHRHLWVFFPASNSYTSFLSSENYLARATFSACVNQCCSTKVSLHHLRSTPVQSSITRPSYITHWLHVQGWVLIETHPIYDCNRNPIPSKPGAAVCHAWSKAIGFESSPGRTSFPVAGKWQLVHKKEELALDHTASQMQTLEKTLGWR